MLTLREIFEKVKAHLLTQNSRSMMPGDDMMCAYRGVNGMMCAVGCLIPDEKYTRGIETQPVNFLKEDLFPDMPVDDSMFWTMLRQLQKIHDDKSVVSWNSELNILYWELFREWPSVRCV